jgi:GntR family transcriptional regulator
VAAQLPVSRIDRTSPVPFYFQLKKTLAEEIVASRWHPGDRLPSEPSICTHFDVSRTTVRQALGELEAEGMIRREKGRGTFVAERRSTSWLLQSSHGFYEEATGAGHTVRSRVLRRDLEALPSWACDALDLAGGSMGVTVERLRWVDDRLVMYVITHLPAHLAEVVLAADLENGSLYRTLEDGKGVSVFGGRRVVEAVTGQEELARLLKVQPGAPLLFVESVSWDRDLRPFECYRAWHRADRTKIEVQVVNQSVAAKAGLDPTTLRLVPR